MVRVPVAAPPIIISCLVDLSLENTSDAPVKEATVELSDQSAFKTLLILKDMPLLESTHFACTRYNERSALLIFYVISG